MGKPFGDQFFNQLRRRQLQPIQGTKASIRSQSAAEPSNANITGDENNFTGDVSITGDLDLGAITIHVDIGGPPNHSEAYPVGSIWIYPTGGTGQTLFYYIGKVATVPTWVALP